MEIKLHLFSLLFVLASFPLQAYCTVDNQRFHDRDCTYVIYVQTGDVQNAGTYATVSLELRDIYTNRVNITNLRSWGLMGGSWHDYFRRGNLDAFAGKGKCLEGPVCSITLSHDNSSIGPGWYVDFVDVTSVAPHGSCRKVRFPVNAWLAFDEPPYYSTRRGVYLCDEVVSGEKKVTSPRRFEELRVVSKRELSV